MASVSMTRASSANTRRTYAQNFFWRSQLLTFPVSTSRK